MVVDWPTIRDLLFEHRYQDAVTAYNAALREESEPSDSIEIRGRAFLCLGHLESALDDFSKYNEIHRVRSKGRVQRGIITIGVIHWLLGRRSEAVRILQKAVEGVLQGRIHYGDNAGGVSQGLVLWYMGVTSNDAATTEYALSYLRTLAAQPRIEFWPGPLALFALHQISIESLLAQAAASMDRNRCIRAARTDLLKRRQVCQAFFYAGVRNRSLGDEPACYREMQACFALENPIIEDEWYLARAEVGSMSPARS